MNLRSGSLPARRWQLVGALLVVAVMAVVLWSPLPQPVRAAASDWGVMAMIVLTTVALGLQARNATSRRRRRAWGLFALGSLLAAAGNALLLLPPTPHTQTALVGATVAALLVSSAGAAMFPAVRLSKVELGRIVADGLVIGLSLLSVLFGVASHVQPDLTSTGAAWSVLVLPIADCVVVTVLVIMVLRSRPADYSRFYAAAVGFICIGVADTAFVLREAVTGSAITGEPSDLGWFVGYLCITLAVLGPDHPVPDAGTEGESNPLLGTSTVYACLVAAAVVLMTGTISEAAAPTRVMAVLAVVAVAMRELLITYDNMLLRRELRGQVERRTEQLRDSAGTSAAIAGSIADGVLAADPDGRLTYANAAAVQLLGWPQQRLVGRTLAELVDTGRAADGDTGAPEPAAASQDGRTHAGRGWAHHRDGTAIPVHVTVSPLTRAGRTRGSVIVFRDLREQDRVDRLKSEFVSTVSHELRTPLTSIRGVLGLLANDKLGPLAPRAATMVGIASASADRLSRLVEDLLDVGRLQSGRVPLSISDVDTRELARRAIADTHLLFSARDVRVRLHAEGAPPPAARADPDRLHQVLINLLSNAAKYAPPGTEVGVTLGRAPAGTAEESRVRLVVTDCGPGIPADKLDSVFDRFVQVDQSDSRPQEGTGLGLAIARDLVAAMHGTLVVTSEPGVRTAFTVELPGARPAPADPVGTLLGGAPGSGTADGST